MKEREKSQPTPPLPERILGEAACLALEYGIRPKIEGIENFAQTREHLKEGSVTLYFNHRSGIDPGLITRLLIENVREEIEHCVVPGSQKHLDPERSFFRQIKPWGMRGFAWKMGFELCPVVQLYDEKSYPKEFVTNTNYKFIRRALKALQSPGGVVLIAPEGTRNQENPRLQKAERGIGRLIVKGKNTVAQPIGLIDSGLPRAVRKSPTVVVGPLYSSKEVFEFAQNKNLEIEDALMVLLGQLLPEEYWGEYASLLAELNSTG